MKPGINSDNHAIFDHKLKHKEVLREKELKRSIEIIIENAELSVSRSSRINFGKGSDCRIQCKCTHYWASLSVLH